MQRLAARSSPTRALAPTQQTTMLDLKNYESLGAALRDALERWADETCLIEADRDREKCRLTYRQFKEAALPLSSTLQKAGFVAGDWAAIIISNLSKLLTYDYGASY